MVALQIERENLLVSYGEEFAFAVREFSQYSQTINGHGACNDCVYISQGIRHISTNIFQKSTYLSSC